MEFFSRQQGMCTALYTTTRHLCDTFFNSKNFDFEKKTKIRHNLSIMLRVFLAARKVVCGK
jgi:hypothetical protein